MFNKITLLTALVLTFGFSGNLFSELKWTEPETISEMNDLVDLKCAFNNSGSGVAVWTEHPTEQFVSKLYYSLYDNMRWTEPKILTSSSLFKGYSVAINESGQAVIAWNKLTSGHPINSYSVIEATIFERGAWREPFTIQTGFDSYSSIPKVAINDDGEILIAWIHEDGGKHHLASISAKELLWSRLFNLSDSVSKERAFDLSFNNSGNGIVAWANDSDEIEIKRYSRSTWSHDTTIISPQNFSNEGVVLTSYADNGHPAVVWTATYSDGYHFDYSFYNDGWLPATSMGVFAGREPTLRCAFSVNSKAQALVAWSGSDGQLNIIDYDPDQGGRSVLLSDKFNAKKGRVFVNINEDGNGGAVWRDEPNALRGNSLVAGQWGLQAHTFTEDLGPAPGEVFFNSSNQAVSVWLSEDSQKGDFTIQAAYGKEGTKALPPYALNVQASRLVTVENKSPNKIEIKWEVSQSPDLKKIHVYRNNFLIAKLSPSQFEYADLWHDGIMVYRVEALDQNNQVLASGLATLN